MATPGTTARSDKVGRSLTHLCGGALAFNLLLVVGLLLLLAWEGGGYFWPKRLVEFELADGRRVLGEEHDRAPLPAADGSNADGRFQLKLKIGNRDLTGKDFEWFPESEVRARSEPADAVVLERLEWGNFYGRMVEIRRGEEVLAAGGDAAWALFPILHERKLDQIDRIEALDEGELSDVTRALRDIDWERRALELDPPKASTRAARTAELDARADSLRRRSTELTDRLNEMRRELLREVVVMVAADGTRKELPVGEIVRAFRPNGMGVVASLGLYASRLAEFVFDEPRESNTEGGIFPAIFGTVLMVFLMAFAVVPFGVLAALYLREYAKQGPVVRLVRIAVNNLAGTPSIVFGVFGLGFFVYLIGGSIDRLFYPERLPTPTFGTGGVLWASLTLALLTVPVVIVATEEGLAAVPRMVREGSLALGATKWETIRKVVLPASMPAILTGMILAMGRAAGEVAPLMIVGMVKLADLPLDAHPPFLHLEGKFMHLGFHIYDVGFQSPNVEATKPVVSATALLLILVVTTMNLFAIRIRNRLRRKYAQSGV